MPLHALALMLFACGGQAPEPEPEPEPTVEEEPPPPEPTTVPWAIRTDMQTHFAHSTDAVFYVFRGELDKAKEEASQLAEYEQSADMPTEWGPYLAELKTAADSLSKADDLEAASIGVVAVSGACANCHRDNDGPSLSVDDAMGDADVFGDTAMGKHQWAAYLMWTGLIVPSDEVFDAGTRALGHDQESMPDKLPEGAKPIGMKLHDIAATAKKSETYEARGAAFGEFIQTCAECHKAVGAEFPAP